MAGKKRNPADAAVEFFQTADLEAARTILAVCQGTIARRAKSEPARAHLAAEAARRPARRSREVTAAEVSTPEGGAPGASTEGLTTRSEG